MAEKAGVDFFGNIHLPGIGRISKRTKTGKMLLEKIDRSKNMQFSNRLDFVNDYNKRVKKRETMDKQGNKVESFRLTPEQRNFQKSFKKLAQMRDLLTAKSLMLGQAQLSTQQMLREVAVGMQKLRIPKEGIRELPGMGFSVEEDQVSGPSGQGSDIFNI